MGAVAVVDVACEAELSPLCGVCSGEVTGSDGAEIPSSLDGKSVTGVTAVAGRLGVKSSLMNPIYTSFPYHGKLLAALAKPLAAPWMACA